MAGSYVIMDKISKAYEKLKRSGDDSLNLTNNNEKSTIEFVHAETPDNYTEEIKKMYKPLNPSSKNEKKHSNNKKPVTESILPLAKFNIFDPSKLSHEWKVIRKIGPGLNNMSNTCFMNSVLQILSYTPPLWQYLIEESDDVNCKASSFCAECALRRLFKEMNNSNNPIWPSTIAHNIRLIGNHLRVGSQEDAHEFLISLLDSLKKHYGINEKSMDRFSRETHLSSHIFGGWLRGCVKCMECGHESITYDPMLEINLEIDRCNNIESAIKLFCSPDKINGKQYYCDSCKCNVSATKTFLFHKAPKFLTLHLKRFRFEYGKCSKNSKHIEFDEHLDLTEYVYKTDRDYTYNLYGIIVHMGSGTNYGHYMAYAKSPLGIWSRLNDSFVNTVGVSDVLSESAYLLFYTQDENNSTDLADYIVKVQDEMLSNKSEKMSLNKSSNINTVTNNSNYKISMNDESNDPWSDNQKIRQSNSAKWNEKNNVKLHKKYNSTDSGPNLYKIGSSVTSWDDKPNNIDKCSIDTNILNNNGGEVYNLERDRGKKRKSRSNKLKKNIFRHNQFQLAHQNTIRN